MESLRDSFHIIYYPRGQIRRTSLGISELKIIELEIGASSFYGVWYTILKFGLAALAGFGYPAELSGKYAFI